jgi:hypothetical protein
LSFAPHLLSWSPVQPCHDLLVSGNDTTLIQRLAHGHAADHQHHQHMQQHSGYVAEGKVRGNFRSTTSIQK